MAQDTWTNRELPLLEKVVVAEGDRNLTLADLCASAEVMPEEAKLSIRALMEGRYLTALPVEVAEEWLPIDYQDRRTLERGRRAVGQWPSEDPFESFIATIDRTIDSEPDEDRRTRLEKFRESVTATGKTVATGLLLEFLKQQTGLR